MSGLMSDENTDWIKEWVDNIFNILANGYHDEDKYVDDNKIMILY